MMAMLLSPSAHCNAAATGAEAHSHLRRGASGGAIEPAAIPPVFTLKSSTKPPPPPVPAPLAYGDLRLGGLGILPTPTPMPPPPPPDPPIPPIPLPDMSEVGMDELWEMKMPANIVDKNYTLDYLGNRVDRADIKQRTKKDPNKKTDDLAKAYASLSPDDEKELGAKL